MPTRREVLAASLAVPVVLLAAPAIASAAGGTGVHVEKQGEKLIVWQRLPGHRWTRYELKRVTIAAKHVDSWQLVAVDMGDLANDTPVPGAALLAAGGLTTTSAWDYAVTLDHTSDRTFGCQHGFETATSVEVLLDGQSFSIAALPAWSTCSTFEFVQTRVTNDPLDHLVETADVVSRHTITAAGLAIRWQLTWSAAFTVKYAYGAMLPAVRGETTTDRCRFLDSPTVYDIGVAGHNRPHRNTPGIELFNGRNAARMTLEVGPSYFDGFRNSETWGLWVHNNPAYNKVYPTRIHKPTAVVAGEVWELDATYRFAWPA